MVVTQDKTKLPALEASFLVICCLLLLTPLVYTTQIAMGVMSFKFFYLFFLTCAGALVAVMQLLRQHREKGVFFFSRLDIVVFVFILYLVCDIFWIGKPANFISEQSEKIITFLCGGSVYFSVRVFAGNGNVRRQLYALAEMTFMGIVLLECLFAVLQKFSLLPGLSEDPRIKVSGTFSHPAMLGGLLAVIIPFLYSRLEIRWGQLSGIKASAVAVILAGLAALLLSESRAAFLAVLAGVLYCEFAKNDVAPRAWAYLKAHKAILAGGVVGLAAFLFVVINIRTVSVFGRMLVWKICRPMVADAPVFGHGLGTFREIYPAYQMNYFSDPANAGDKRLADFVLYAYNEFLQIWIETGIVGLGLFVLMIVLSVFARQSKSAFSAEERGVGAAILALMVFSLFSYPFSLSYMVLYFFFFLAVSGAWAGDRGRKAGIPAKAAIALVAILPFFFARPVVLKLAAYRQLAVAEGKTDIAASGQIMGELYDVLWNDRPYLSQYAGLLNEANNQELGLKLLLKKKGLTYLDYLLAGDMYSNLERPDSAIIYYEKAHLLLPNRDQPLQRITSERSLRQRFNP
ncbi:O-antigen ligase [Chitinophaga sp. XS-30]|uniref:O-antigen ligase family protein n=1 Tax=Chitinophaga sp. XS-30 TaxID=2604421 RepID=UPI0011DCCA7D|nr:O-antigen ligase family protein [Chitinophaga sp. XS-30]QEH42013.1 hypothetical protein FW415_14475 [Chitinophaga sp. XS-30]